MAQFGRASSSGLCRADRCRFEPRPTLYLYRMSSLSSSGCYSSTKDFCSWRLVENGKKASTLVIIVEAEEIRRSCLDNIEV